MNRLKIDNHGSIPSRSKCNPAESGVNDDCYVHYYIQQNTSIAQETFLSTCAPASKQCTILDFCRYADFATFFFLLIADANIFPFVWKQHQVSPVWKL